MSPLEENGVAVPEEASAKEPTLQRAFAEEYRAQAHRMVDFIADYYRDLETCPVMSAVQVLLYDYPAYLLSYVCECSSACWWDFTRIPCQISYPRARGRSCLVHCSLAAPDSIMIATRRHLES